MSQNASEKCWEVYIIETVSGSLYTGISNNLEARFLAHQKGKGGAKFFSFSSPLKIVFRKSFANRSEASKKEAFIKKMSRKEKLDLIALQ